MRKIKFMLLAIMLMGAASSVKAQEVFNIVLHKAENVVNNPHANEFDLKVNQYKVTALRYIATTGIKINGKVQEEFLNMQAYALNVFLQKYMTAITKTPKESRKNIVMQFVHATRNHPLYKDNNKEATESFVKDPGGFTPFSLNVDWEKALEEIEKAK